MSWEMVLRELVQAMHEMLHRIVQFLPRLVEMFIIVLVGWLIAYVLKFLFRTVLRFTKFDKLSEDAGAAQLLKKADLPSSTELLSRVVFWVAWFSFILVGLNVLGIVGIQEPVSRFFGFLPRLFAGLFVFFFGLLAASFFSRAALLAAVNANMPSPRLVSTTVRTLIIVFTVSMGLEEFGLGERTVVVAFAIVFGALMLGLALAFGLGGRDLARRYLEKRFMPEKKEEHEDELSPL